MARAGEHERGLLIGAEFAQDLVDPLEVLQHQRFTVVVSAVEPDAAGFAEVGEQGV
ncbi:MAG TPA: hypothetical protein VGQ92_26455 [Actinoplanes sp.]|nr:hypothetical protein [Actinoplanes sp.]